MGSSVMPILSYSFPYFTFGVCAKCTNTDISELQSNCPKCGHDLGPISPLFKAPTPRQIPLSLSPHIEGDYSAGMGSTSKIAHMDSLSEAEKLDDEKLSKNRQDESIRSYIEYKLTPRSWLLCAHIWIHACSHAR